MDGQWRRWVLCVLATLFGPMATTSQEVPTVRATGLGEWGNAQLVEELRIGVLEGAEEYIFGRVMDLAATADGSVFVLDAQGPKLRLYGPDGTFVRDVGRVGQGPGEYEMPVAAETTFDNNVAVYDVALGRVSLFDADGEYLRSFRVETGGTAAFGGFRPLSGGGFLIYGARYDTFVDSATGREIGIEETLTSLYLKLSEDGQVVDSLTVPTLERIPSFAFQTKEGVIKPFTRELIVKPSPLGYLVSADNASYQIELLDRNARPMHRIQRDYEPVVVQRAERRQWAEWVDFTDRRGGASAGVELPDRKPPFRQMYVGDTGRIWIHRYGAAVERSGVPSASPERPPQVTLRDVPTFDVFEASGDFVGSVEIPEDVVIVVRTPDRLWGVAQGSFDEAYVVRYRVVTER